MIKHQLTRSLNDSEQAYLQAIFSQKLKEAVIQKAFNSESSEIITASENNIAYTVDDFEAQEWSLTQQTGFFKKKEEQTIVTIYLPIQHPNKEDIMRDIPIMLDKDFKKIMKIKQPTQWLLPPDLITI